MIAVRNLTKKYHKGGETQVVLDDVNFKIKRGELIMVLGESGSGKTTLLNCLGSLDTPDEGEIIIDGFGDILSMSDRELSRYRNAVVGHVFQTFNLKPTYTAHENVMVPLLLTHVSRNERMSRVENALRDVGLWERRDYRPIELSEGQAQRIAIARAIVNKPSILLADEPTGNLDPRTSQNIMELLIRLNREINMTLVMVTHDMRILDNAHKILLLHDGNVSEELPETDIISRIGGMNKIRN